MPRALELYGALKANDDFFAKHWAPDDLTDVVGSDGVVYRYFAGYCFRFHPLANFGVLNARIASGDVDGTRELADALIARGVYQKGGGIAWEYDFSFGGGRAPWLSGMAQSVAAQAFAAAAALVTDRSTAYMNEGRAAERVIPKRLMTTVAAGPWIKLYGFSSLVVLNAQLQSTLSLQAYATASGDTTAGALAKRMANAAYATLPRFDTGYWSYYSLPNEPSPDHLPPVRRVAAEEAGRRRSTLVGGRDALRLLREGAARVPARERRRRRGALLALEAGDGAPDLERRPDEDALARRRLADGHVLRPRTPGIYPVHVDRDRLARQQDGVRHAAGRAGGEPPPRRHRRCDTPQPSRRPCRDSPPSPSAPASTIRRRRRSPRSSAFASPASASRGPRERRRPIQASSPRSQACRPASPS